MRQKKADSALSLGFLKIVNLRRSGLYLFTQAEVWSDHAVYRQWVGDMGDDRAETVGTYRKLPFPKRLQDPPVNLQPCDVFKRRTPCLAILTHPARDGRDYRTVGNTDYGWRSHSIDLGKYPSGSTRKE